MKRKISSPPILAHFSIDDATYVTCDASEKEVEAVLTQIKQSIEKPIAFASQALTKQEKYSVEDREALTCLWACER